jgi:hypothetical protein
MISIRWQQRYSFAFPSPTDNQSFTNCLLQHTQMLENNYTELILSVSGIGLKKKKTTNIKDSPDFDIKNIWLV